MLTVLIIRCSNLFSKDPKKPWSTSIFTISIMLKIWLANMQTHQFNPHPSSMDFLPRLQRNSNQEQVPLCSFKRKESNHVHLQCPHHLQVHLMPLKMVLTYPLLAITSTLLLLLILIPSLLPVRLPSAVNLRLRSNSLRRSNTPPGARNFHVSQ